MFIYNSYVTFLSLKAAGPRSCNGAACASSQQYGFAIAAISTALKPNPCLRDADQAGQKAPNA